MAITLDGTNGINSSGVIVAPDGSASAPSITNDGDTNTGIYFPAADTIAFTKGGAEAMRLDSSGNVGIGTSSPVNMLHLSNTAATTHDLAFSRNTTYGTSTGIGGVSWYSQDGTTRLSRIASDTDGASTSTRLTFSTSSSGTEAERMRIDSSGNLMVGKTTTTASGSTGAYILSTGGIVSTLSGSTNATSSYDLYSTGASNYRFYVGMAGTVFATNTTISAISDVRHKENIRDLDVGLAEIMQLQPRVFDWKEGKGKNTQNDRGFIAQEFEQVFPDLIDEWKDPAPEGEEPYKSVRQDLIPVLVKAIQELKAELDQAKARIAVLENNNV